MVSTIIVTNIPVEGNAPKHVVAVVSLGGDE